MQITKVAIPKSGRFIDCLCLMNWFLGLSRDTTTDSLRAYFTQFGEVRDALVKIDSQTGQSRGFGFIIFANDASTDAVASAGNHTIDGKTVSQFHFVITSGYF